MRPRRRCPYCRCLFFPDGRVAERQRACSKPGCQQQRRRETQRRCREKHPTDAVGRRMRAAIAAAKAEKTVKSPTGPPSLLDRLPWDELRDEISPQVLVMAAYLVRLVAVWTKDEIRAQAVEIQKEAARLVAHPREDRTADRARAG
jgi:hypothetical protein